MTKISQLSSIGDSLAVGDQFLIRDIDDAVTPNKSVTISGMTRALDAGTALAPALAFASDKNTGIYNPGADTLAFVEGGTEAMRIDSSGRVGIGTSSPSDRLHVAGGYLRVTGPAGDGSNIYLYANNATTNPVRIGQGFGTATDNIGFIVNLAASDLILGTNNTERLRIDSSGRVGIGTSSPGSHGGQKLTVSDGFIAVSTNFASATSGELRFIGRPDGINYNWAGIRTISDVNMNQGVLAFFTSASNTSGESSTERLRIDSSGRLLMGATSTNEGSTAIFQGYDGLSTNPGVIRICRGVATPSSSQVLGYLAFGDSSHATAAYMSAERDGGTWTSGSSLPAALTFATVANGAILPTERMRIDSSGRLLVGTSTSVRTAKAHAQVQIFKNDLSELFSAHLGFNGTDASARITLSRSRNTTYGSYTILQNNDEIGEIGFAGDDGVNYNSIAAQIRAEVDGTPGASDMPGRLVFSTTADGQSSPTERMRIGSTGWTDVFGSSTYTLVARNANGAGTSNFLFAGTHSSTGTQNGTVSFQVFTNGNVVNTNNSYGALSDIKLKENIVDANSQWDDIKALQVRNYNFKEGQTHTQIGLIAQETELVSPGLVTESPDRDEEGNDLGTVTKSISYSVLYMKAVKALQETMERIETLEAKVAALEGV